MKGSDPSEEELRDMMYLDFSKAISLMSYEEVGKNISYNELVQAGLRKYSVITISYSRQTRKITRRRMKGTLMKAVL